MKDILLTVTGLPAGLLLGAFFYGGLWLTVRKGMASVNTAWWFLLSFVIRMGVTMAGFYYVSSGSWERLVMCLCGFVAGRIIITKLTRSLAKEVSNED